MRKLLHLAPLFAVSFGVLYACWVCFVGTFAAHELELGIGAAFVGAVGLCVVQNANDAHFRPRLKHWLQVLRTPWYIVADSVQLFLISVKDLLGIKRAESLFRLATFDAGAQCNVEDTGRRVLTVAYTTCSPSFVVLGINVRDRYMVFHQLQRGEVPQLDKDLGVRA